MLVTSAFAQCSIVVRIVVYTYMFINISPQRGSSTEVVRAAAAEWSCLEAVCGTRGSATYTVTQFIRGPHRVYCAHVVCDVCVHTSHERYMTVHNAQNSLTSWLKSFEP